MTPDELFLLALQSGYVRVEADRGLVFSCRWGSARPLGALNAKGYVVFTLHCAGERKQIKAHRAIWLAVNGAIPAGLMPDHENRNKSDNRISNLRLLDDVGNAANRRSYAGVENPAARINETIAGQIREAHLSLQSYSLVASSFGVSRSLVAQIVRGELWGE